MMFCLPIYHQTDFNLSSNGLQSIIKRTSKHHRLKTKTSSNGIHSCYPSNLVFWSLNVSFPRRNSIIYETKGTHLRMPRHKAPSLNREGWGGSPVGVGLPPPFGRGRGWVLPFTATPCHQTSYTKRWSFFICYNSLIILPPYIQKWFKVSD